MNHDFGRWAHRLLATALLATLAACSLGGSGGHAAAPVGPSAPGSSTPTPAPSPDTPSTPTPKPSPGDVDVRDDDDATPTTVRKASYGHYFAMRYSDAPADAAMLCAQPGVAGVVWRRTWFEVEPSPGQYDFDSFDRVLEAIAKSPNPQCQLWLFVEYKSFANSPVKNPCPAHLRAGHSGLNAHGHGAATCFMWEPEVATAYVQMMRAAAQRYDDHPRVEGLVLQESALGFTDGYSQDVADGGTYTATAWRDALSTLVTECGAAFAQSPLHGVPQLHPWRAEVPGRRRSRGSRRTGSSRVHLRPGPAARRA
jgi:hypothetical protein